MLLLALAVAALTARFFGLRPAAIAGAVSLGLLVIAGLAPLSIAIVIYLLHAAWLGGLWYFGGKVISARRTDRWSQARTWARRGWSLWKRR